MICCVLLSLAFGFIRFGSAEYDNCFLHFVSGMWPSLCTRSGMSLVCVVICSYLHSGSGCERHRIQNFDCLRYLSYSEWSLAI